MDIVHLEEMVQRGESETLEFKKSTALLSSVGETLCGFLNGKGGKVVIGITADKKIVGQSVSDNTFRELAELLKKFEPSPAISLDRIELEPNKEVIVLTASPRACDVPYVYCGRPYQRIESTVSQMTQHTYQKLLLERSHHNQRWENEIASDYTVNDLDVEEIWRTMRKGAESRRLPEYQGEDIPSILDKLGLRSKGQLLNAAIVLFGKRFLPEFTQCQLRLARFKGVDKTEFIDQSQLIGNAFYLLEEAMIFLRKHLPLAGKILPGVLERVDEPLFPLEALREALVNAFCHRTYTSPGGAVSIAIFDDHLEIWNDGTLPFGLTTADLKKDHTSHQRNPLIATMFYHRGLIEKWGRGTQKIVSLCVKAGHPEPEFSEQTGSFVVRFLPNSYIAPYRISHDLTDRQRHILVSLAVSLGKGITFTEVKVKLPTQPADRTLRDDFQHLKKLGLIDVRGYGRGAKWYLVDPNGNKAE
jgi:ATP-dependent DNA helicase RecG